LGTQLSGDAGRYAGCGVFFFWEKQLASLRHLFPCQKNTPHPPTDGQHRNAEYKKQKAKSKRQKAKGKRQKAKGNESNLKLY